MGEQYWLDEMEKIDEQIEYDKIKHQENEEMLVKLKILYGDKSAEYNHVERLYKRICREFNDNLKRELALFHGLVDDGVMTDAEVLATYGEFLAGMIGNMTKSGKTNEEYYNLFAKKSMYLNVKIYAVLDVLEHDCSAAYAEEIREHFLPILKGNSSYETEYELLRAAMNKCMR